MALARIYTPRRIFKASWIESAPKKRNMARNSTTCAQWNALTRDRPDAPRAKELGQRIATEPDRGVRLVLSAPFPALPHQHQRQR